MKKLLFIFVMLSLSIAQAQNYYSNRDANKVAVGAVFTIIGGELIRDGLNVNYSYSNNPLSIVSSHLYYLVGRHRHCYSYCRGTGSHYFYQPRVVVSHSRYPGDDGYYYCYQNCQAAGSHNRVQIMITPGRDVYREARDINYYRGYYRSQHDYLRTLHNRTPVIRYHKRLRRR